MSITVDAVYENGVLKLTQPVPFKENEKVRITIEPASSWADRTAGMIQWTGDVETLERIAIDAEFDPQESA
jgi:predicted DNA-binding antitoxin AbrB/MazE fold protein